jgi:DNA-binding NarL/FixJ family response regulator
MRIFIADHEPKVRSALCTLLRRRPGIEVVGDADSLEGLLDRLDASQPDLLLLHWRLGQESPTLLARLKREFPGLSVIVLSVRQEACREALAAGAEAFVCKMDPPDKLLAAVERVQRRYALEEGEECGRQEQGCGISLRQPAEADPDGRAKLKIRGFGRSSPEPAPQSGV